MATSRSMLAMHLLNDFALFCESRGWTIVETKGHYEVLRATHQDCREPLIVYRRLDAKEHYTTHGEALKLAKQFVKYRHTVEKASAEENFTRP